MGRESSMRMTEDTAASGLGPMNKTMGKRDVLHDVLAQGQSGEAAKETTEAFVPLAKERKDLPTVIDLLDDEEAGKEVSDPPAKETKAVENVIADKMASGSGLPQEDTAQDRGGKKLEDVAETSTLSAKEKEGPPTVVEVLDTEQETNEKATDPPADLPDKSAMPASPTPPTLSEKGKSLPMEDSPQTDAAHETREPRARE